MGRGKVFVLPKEAIDGDHLFHARVSTNRESVNRVLCSLKLPQKKSEKITLVFCPTPRQAQALQFSRILDVDGECELSGNAYTIQAKQVWITGNSNGFKDGISYFSTFHGFPAELHIVLLLGEKRGNYLVRGAFSLTDCPVVNAASMITRSYTGNVRIRRVVAPTFNLRTGIRLMFKYHFDSTEDATGHTTTTSHLAAEFKALIKIPTNTFAEVKRDLDVFLRLASFAARYRCVCPNWSYSDDGSSYVTHYFQNIVMPKGHVPSVNETLIDVTLFPKFIRRAYNFYSRNAETELLDNAIFALANEHSSLEDRFTRVFSGLESLLWFAYRSGGGTKKRVPIKERFKVFTARHKPRLDDLWPLFDDSAGPPLYAVRNAIAHGEFLDPGKSVVVSCAQENLNWTVERMLLTILDWPVEKSHVDQAYLRSWSAAYDWAAFRSQW